MAGPFEMKLREFAAKAKEDADAAVRGVVLEVQRRVVLRSPVDTGRFRANWRYGLDDVSTGAPEPGGTKERPAPGAPSPQIGPGDGVGHRHYITNNLPYGWALETGHSTKAPAGMVGITVAEFAAIVDKEVEKVRS